MHASFKFAAMLILVASAVARAFPSPIRYVAVPLNPATVANFFLAFLKTLALTEMIPNLLHVATST
jgi:hypothetical protein